MQHPDDLEITHVGLSQAGLIHDRKLFFIDSNRDLFLVRCTQPQPYKLANVRWLSARSAPTTFA